MVKIHPLFEHTKTFLRHFHSPGRHIMPMYLNIFIIQVDMTGVALMAVNRNGKD